MGSSAEQGSSISSTSGRVAMARAMQSRCCWPPESSRALLWRRSFTSSQIAAWRRLRSTASSRTCLRRSPSMRRPKTTFS